MKAIHARKLIKSIDQTYTEMFSGKVYTVGKGAVSIRNHSGKAENTVIGVHGFLENHCYFTQSYQDATTELILLTCSNYHIPVSGPSPEPAPWEVPIKSLEGTIQYDAKILNQAMENLPTTENVRVHGHSRGGAVVLEAIRQRPELYTHADIVLEASVLPQGQLHPLVTALLEPVSHGMWPWVIRFINSTPSSSYGQSFFGKMNGRKKQLLNKLFTATKDHLTIVRNIEDIMTWMEKTSFEVYDHITHGTFLIPKVDRILDRSAMLSSAENSPNSVRIIETDASSHFITLDNQKWLPTLDGSSEPRLQIAQ
ncbi:alpha/beta hydrolase [Alkalimarinus alittae]|uniref:Alpha/beta hydrolase n=1 Tax=Alkalimarinus alittae TaxID=2961619 RepID=A0ABY6N3S7_9ALTE|nr:alpha/beta hydrolase [Alkalimarinus alittae]UZE96771.1 alpha/beta hydrolase [Alkalimarinus alittae]